MVASLTVVVVVVVVLNNRTGGHEMSPRYKFVVQVVLMQNNGQGIG